MIALELTTAVFHDGVTSADIQGKDKSTPNGVIKENSWEASFRYPLSHPLKPSNDQAIRPAVSPTGTVTL